MLLNIGFGLCKVIAACLAKVEPSLSDTRIGTTMKFQISSPYSRREVNITIYNYSTSHRHIVKQLFAYVKPPSFRGLPVQILTIQREVPSYCMQEFLIPYYPPLVLIVILHF
jgi:hypothetical protein